MKKPRTGGAGLLGFHWGEPVMAWGSAINNTTRLRLLPDLYVRHFVSSDLITGLWQASA